MRQPDSLRKRYFFKVITNIFIFGTGAVTQAIIPRGLGPKAYGDFSFLSSFFSQLVSFFDMGTSPCFYTKFSQRPKEHSLVAFYSYLAFLMAFVLFIFVQIIVSLNWYKFIWPGQQIFYIYLATGFGFLTWLIPVLASMCDAYGITVAAEKIKIFQRIFAVVLILLLFIFRSLNLSNFFYYQYFISLLLGTALFFALKKEGHFVKESFIINIARVKGYIKEFGNYSHPLFIYSLMSLLGNLFDKWFLQLFGGSVEQGFYGFSFQIGSLCFLFSSAMTPLLTREFSIAHANNDISRISNLYKKHIPLFYAIAACISCFVAVQSNKVAYIMGGREYNNAVIPLIILAIYPAHQTYGQLCGAVYYATGQTRLYRNIGIGTIAFGLPLTYFLVAPKNFLGLNLGATGLAIKTELIAIISVNLLLWFNTRLMKLSFLRFIFHQVYTILLFVFLALVFSYVIDKIIPNIFAAFLISGVLYTAAAIYVLFHHASVFRITREELRGFVNKFREKIVRKNDVKK